jgi:hypothetical protein
MVKQHCINILQAMVEKLSASGSCQIDRNQPDAVKHIIPSTINIRDHVDLINMTAYSGGSMK